MFGRRRNGITFTVTEINNLIIIASLIDFDELGIVPGHEMLAAVEKAKSVVIQTETDTGFTGYLPAITIVG